jgi:hypothetical protein
MPSPSPSKSLQAPTATSYLRYGTSVDGERTKGLYRAVQRETDNLWEDRKGIAFRYHEDPDQKGRRREFCQKLSAIRNDAIKASKESSTREEDYETQDSELHLR